ncbi:MAG: hypothetical protein MUP58_02520 [Candidatus Nanohaloarchaeota archaeon QJJ-9]|nr:hypothetical protein [Candidatus Nanohaloarchaeota archaeon QJJ-9]
MNRKLMILMVASLAFVLAGCTSPLGNGDDTDDENGVSFDFTPQDGLSIDFKHPTGEAYVNEQTTFEADVANTGEGEANITGMKLYYASWASGENCSDCSTPITLQGGSAAAKETGEQKYFKFSPNVDLELDQDQSKMAHVGLRTTYEYTSKTLSSVVLMNEDTWEQKKDTRSKMDNEYRGGPVRLKFTSVTPQEAGSNVQLKVEVENVGDGRLNNSEITSLKVLDSTGDIVSDDCEWTDSKRIDGTRTFICSFDSDEIDVPSKEKGLRAVADYVYTEDDTVDVQVTNP